MSGIAVGALSRDPSAVPPTPLDLIEGGWSSRIHPLNDSFHLAEAVFDSELRGRQQLDLAALQEPTQPIAGATLEL